MLTQNTLTKTSLPHQQRWHVSATNFGILLTIPALIILVAVFIYPMVFSALTSFYDYNISDPASTVFIGLGNYTRIFADEAFNRALSNSILYVVIALPIEFLLGLALAMALATIERLRGLFRTGLIIPMMLAPTTIGLMWKFMYNDQLGVISGVIRSSGGTPPLWLTDPNIALFSIIAVEVWATVPIFVVLLLAGLLSIPQDFYEAAAIDGAGAWANFRYVTLPLLRPIIVVALLLRGIDAFRVFDIVFVMTKGGPALRTDVLSYYVYRTAFNNREFGTASAVGWIMIIILLVAAALLIVTSRRGQDNNL